MLKERDKWYFLYAEFCADNYRLVNLLTMKITHLLVSDENSTETVASNIQPRNVIFTMVFSNSRGI